MTSCPPLPDLQAAHADRPLDDGLRQWAEQRRELEIHHSCHGGERHGGAPRYSPLRGLLGKLYGPMMTAGHWFLDRSGLYALGRRNALDVRRKAFDIRLEGLPEAFDGYRILHLSDLHLDMLDGLEEAILAAVDGLSVDLCVITGDYRAGFSGDYRQASRGVARIVGAIDSRDGFLGTLGNHDDHGMVDAFAAFGLPILVNRTTTVSRRGQTLHLTGVDDVNRFYTPAADAALRALPAEAFGIALVHSPEMAAVAADAGYRLYLCGHTHGGQICLPGGIPVIVNLKRHARLARGHWRYRGMRGYTSCGAGLCGMPARFFSRGEVAVMTLRR